MEHPSFVNYYEVLEISANASPETIERVFRELARRYHPDNHATGDRSRFDAVLEAHDTLKDTSKRSEYDVRYNSHLKSRCKADDVIVSDDIGRDLDIQNNILSILYVKRRADVRSAGLSNAAMARRAGCTYDELDFHLWYLKEKGWIRKGDDGLFAITIEGVDRAGAIYQEKMAKKLLTNQS